MLMKEKMLSDAKILIDKCDEIKNKIEKGSIKMQIISNIGIIYNNKLNEISNYYKNRGLSFYENSVFLYSIGRYLADIICKATAALEKYGKEFDLKSDKILEPKVIDNANLHIKEYEKYCIELFSFDIRKDLLKVLDADIAFGIINEKDGGYNVYKNISDEEIKKMNNELYYLGYDTNISVKDILKNYSNEFLETDSVIRK